MPVVGVLVSAMKAPITPTASAILAPLRAAGSAAGSSAKRSACQREASSVRSSFARSGSSEASPSIVVTSTGKKQIRAITTSFGKIPNPHQNTSSTPITGIGTACEPTASG